MKFEIGDTVRCIERCTGLCHSSTRQIKKGEICEIVNTDIGVYDIKVKDVTGYERWVTSEYFERVEFQVGDIVTAKETFVQDDKVIYSDVLYRVEKVCKYDIAIYLDSFESNWWVLANKMRLVNKDKAKEYKAKGDTSMSTLKIKNVIFNDPATIVFWEDGVKTVVKCQKGDKFDPEKGLALAISKRVLGNNYIWHGRFTKWLPKPKKGEKKC